MNETTGGAGDTEADSLARATTDDDAAEESALAAREGGTTVAAEAGAHASPARVEAGVDLQRAARLTQDIVVDDAPTRRELDAAAAELRDLSDHWSERSAEYDPTAAGGVAVEQRSLLGDAVRRFSSNLSAVTALSILVLLAVLAIIVPAVQEYDSTFNFAQANERPSLEHPFGTDNRGRDMWVRVWSGARISLSLGFAVAFTILAVGVIYGSISGFVGGKLDSGMMRLLDALYGLPYLPFAIIFVAVVRAKWPEAPALAYMVPALSITTWFTAARIMRSQVLSLKENEYVEAANSSGARWYRVVGRHIVPNTIGIMVVAIFLEVPAAILGEATLSFLGFGVQHPDTSWGRLAYEGYRDFKSNPHLVWVPGGLIGITVLCAVAVADGLRDALDPRGRRN